MAPLHPRSCGWENGIFDAPVNDIQALPYGRNCFNTLAARSQVPLTLKKTGVILP
jgi:hypothetical protein